MEFINDVNDSFYNHPLLDDLLLPNPSLDVKLGLFQLKTDTCQLETDIKKLKQSNAMVVERLKTIRSTHQ